MKGQSYTSTPPMGGTACTEPQCLYRGVLYPFLYTPLHSHISKPLANCWQCTNVITTEKPTKTSKYKLQTLVSALTIVLFTRLCRTAWLRRKGRRNVQQCYTTVLECVKAAFVGIKNNIFTSIKTLGINNIKILINTCAQIWKFTLPALCGNASQYETSRFTNRRDK